MSLVIKPKHLVPEFSHGLICLLSVQTFGDPYNAQDAQSQDAENAAKYQDQRRSAAWLGGEGQVGDWLLAFLILLRPSVIEGRMLHRFICSDLRPCRYLTPLSFRQTCSLYGSHTSPRQHCYRQMKILKKYFSHKISISNGKFHILQKVNYSS